MRRGIAVLLTLSSFTAGSQSVFSVHDDLLAFPQFEVVFDNSVISELEAHNFLSGSSTDLTPEASSTDIQTKQKLVAATPNDARYTHETMWLNGDKFLCSIPIVTTPSRNSSSEAEARAEEQKELARATDRGWELLQDLEGNCMYFLAGWWSYAFCYNEQVTQFHQLPPNPSNPFPPRRDPTTPEFVLGRAKVDATSNHDEWGNEIDIPESHKGERKTMTTELQVKGDTRYLVHKMEGGTICDLTGRPRRIEVQFHCNPHVTDKIGYIKEVTTCSYVMVVYTPRLCHDVAFMPPKETQANPISCQKIVAEKDIASSTEIESDKSQQDGEKVVTIGGVVVGGSQHVGKEGQKLAAPKNWAKVAQSPTIEVIALSKGKADEGRVEALSEEDLQKLDLDPEVVDELKAELERMAGDKAWKLEVVDIPGESRELRGIVEEDESDDEKTEGSEGSEETYKDEL